jgi:hypothetical protein
MKETPGSAVPDRDEIAAEDRREFLKTAGKLAIYTTPTMMALMYPGSQAIASGGRMGPGGKPPIRRRPRPRMRKQPPFEGWGAR